MFGPWSKGAKIATASVTILILLAAAALWAAPEIARRMAVRQLEDVLVPPVSIADVDLNLFAGTAVVSNLVIGSGDNRFVEIPRTEIEFSPLSLVKGDPVISLIRASEPELYIERTGTTQFNFMRLIDPQRGDQESQGGLGVTVEKVAIDGGKIVFVDETVKPTFERVLRDVTVTTGRISTAPQYILTRTTFEVKFFIDDGRIQIKGNATPATAAPGLEVEASWAELDPTIFRAYLPAQPTFDFSDSRSTGQLRYVLTPVQGNQVGQHFLTANADAGPLKLMVDDDKERSLLATSGFSIEGFRWDFVEGRGRMNRLMVKEPHLTVRRAADGIFNFTQLANSDSTAKDRAPHNEPAKDQAARETGPLFEIASFETTPGTIEFRDRAVEPAVDVTFDKVEFHAKELAWSAQPAEVEVKGFLGKSPVNINGTLQAPPFQTRLKIASEGLPLERFQGYLKPLFANVDAWRGDLRGRVEIALGTAERSDGLSFRLNGQLHAENFELGIVRRPEAPLTAKKLDLRIAALRTEPTFFLDIEQLGLVEAVLSVERNSDGSFNLSPLWTSENETAGSTSASASGDSQASEPSFVVRRSEATRSTINFVDRAIDPSFETALTDVELKLGKLGRQAGRTPLDLQASLEESAKLEVKGWLKPFEDPLRIGLNATLRDFDLAELNPYVTKYVRYRIARGRVTTDVEYRYDAGDLNGENEITIRHLDLGKRLGDEFEEQVGVSLKFAIALLEDAEGRIHLTIPVSGNLSDPNFKFSGIIWKAVRNAVVQFLSAPFQLLGNLVTLGGRINDVSLNPVQFEPGTTDPLPESKKQLQELADFLKSKPRLEVEINGYASTAEIAELKKQQLQKEANAEGADYESALKRLYTMSRDAGEAADLPPVAEMEEYLAKQFRLQPNALEGLAERRVRYTEEALRSLGVQSSRIYGGGSRVVENASAGRVEFDLLS